MEKDEDFIIEEGQKISASKNENKTQTSRKKVDETIDGLGEEALQKMGVPKGLSKVAIKTNGGIFSPNNTPAARIAKNKSRNALAKGYDKASSGKEAFEKKLGNKNFYKNKSKELEENKNKLTDDLNKNKDRQDFAKEKLEAAKQNAKNNKNAESKTGLKEAKKENRDAKKEGKNQKKQLNQVKKDQKNVKKDSRKANMHKFMHPGDAAKTAVNKALKAVKMKIMLILGTFALGIFLAIFVIYLILSPLMEVWGHIDEGITKAVNFSEKVTNFYNGHGFQNTKEAFYDELEYWYEEYDEQLDIPLLLSTIFYTETMGYDTEYGDTDILNSDVGDVDGLNSSSIWGTVRSYIKDKYYDSFETKDESGLNYTSGKIVRLRKLSRHQFETTLFGLEAIPKGTTAYSLKDYMDRVERKLSSDLIELLKEIPSIFNIFDIKDTIYKIVKIVEGEENAASLADTEDGLLAALKRVLKEIFFTVNDITHIEIGAKDENGKFSAIVVHAATYEYNEEEYDQYLREYYIPYMPEFKQLLPKSGSARTDKIDQIIREIKENKETFKDIFLQYVDADSEVYVESCIGGIDTTLVKELILPVKIPEGATISFTDGDTAYGIRNSTRHNGVDLNNSTAGVKEGDDVFAIASGKVIESDASCDLETDDECEKPDLWVKIEHNIVIENKEYKFYSVYRHLQTNSGQPEVGSNVAKGDIVGKIGNIGDSSEAHLHFEFRENDGTDDGKAIDPTNLFIPCKTGSSGTLDGDTTQDRVWNYFISKGYNKFKVAAIMANINNESAFKSNNLENSCDNLYDSSEKYNDETITEAINSGKLSKQEFMASTEICMTYGDGRYGYGLSQWTDPGRKSRLYDMKVEYNVPINDEGVQLDLTYEELEESWVYSNYENIWRNADSEDDIGPATTAYCHGFEIGTGCDARISVALDFYNQYKDK